MKKLLAFTLILVLCLSVVLVACNDKDDNNVKKLPAPAEHLEEARNAVEKTYNTERVSEETDVDYTLSKAVPLNGIYSYPITWTVSDSRITVDNHSDTEVLVNVPDESPVEIKYTLTATITADNGTTAKVEFQHTVPEFKLYDYAGYVAAKDGVKINIDGIVTAILPKGNGASNSGFYMNTVDNDGKPNGGVYVFKTEASTDDIKVGMTVRVAGTKQNYNGTHEIVSCKKIKVLDSTIKTVEPVDFTEAFKNAKDLKATELVGKQAMLVTIKGVEIAENGGSDGSYYYFTLGGKKTYVRISSSACPLTTAEQESFKTFFTGHRGYTADVTGVVCVFSGAFYLTPATAPVFTNEFMKTYTNEEKVDRAIEATEIPSSVESDVEVALANKSQVHDDVAIAWAFKEGTTHTTATIENNLLKVTLGKTKETVTLVATFTIGDGDAKVTKTKEYTIKVGVKEKDWKNAAFAIAEAKKLDGETKEVSKEWYYIYGTIVDDPTADYCNFNFQVGEEKIVVYGLYNEEGTKRYGSKRQIHELPVAKGDVVYLYAQLQNFDGKLEIVNARLQTAPEHGQSNATALTVKEAIEKCEALTTVNKDSEDVFYIVGTVGEIYNTQYCNFYFIQDGEEKTLTVYGLYAQGGEQRYGSKRDIAEIPFKTGDVMILKGNLQKFEKTKDGVTTTTLEITNAVLVSYYTPATATK